MSLRTSSAFLDFELARRVRIKDVKLSYHVDDVFDKDIPALLHGNDGLIYTCVNTPYVAGTDPNMYGFSFVLFDATYTDVRHVQSEMEAAL